MDRHVESTVEIDAPPAVVWRELLDFGSYRDWNPLLRRVRGRPEEGARLRALLSQPGLPPVVILPEVITFDAERELRWRSDSPIPGVLSAEHTFLLTPLDGGDRTRFTQTESFEGVLAAAMPAGLVSQVEQGFGEMNDALKRRVESSVPVAEE
ncbi:SRPBCC domain-containing protein [Salinirubrum litoreum]|uniref:SRPBCC family protein n=1 Tax=Salinirubrum litoreum TaxID=1126234 RepID=A0ABD5RA81_9EURY|nr:SRPBCC domain-containing protein [Salinirubrum litoreum]